MRRLCACLLLLCICGLGLDAVQAAAARREGTREPDVRRQHAAVPSLAATAPDEPAAQDAWGGKRPKRARYSWEALERRYPGSFVTRGPSDRKVAALTFDDVPDPRFTPQVLDVLARYRVRATFFVVGSRARSHPGLVKRIVREGHLVGNHSDSHVLFTEKSLYAFEQQIGRTDHALRRLTGVRPRFIRPPYGEITPKQVAWARRRGYIIANWNVDSVDWRNTPSRTVIANVKKTLQPGSIILLHAGGGSGQDLSGTIDALPELIAWLKRKGYALVTLDELLGQRGIR